MKILIVEDEKEIADGIRCFLVIAGYDVECVYNGTDGLDYINTGMYDLVLLDVMLPGMDGFSVMKQARRNGIRVPIIFLTARTQADDIVEGLDLGGDDYITKPFDGRVLLARINARLRKDDEGKMRVFDIILNSYNYALEKDSKSIKLSKTEYQLLEYLALNKHQILSKDMIISRVWGYDETTDYNNIEVYVSFLRKKLKFVNAEAQIVTKKGIGYSLSGGEK